MSKHDKTPEAPKAMDDTIRENAVGAPATNRQRACWAIKQLVAEVHGLFPETPVEYSGYDGRNTALSVTFDLTTMDGGESGLFNNLMKILDTDERVAEVITADYDQTFVAIKPGPRTQDVRDSFGLADAWSILVDDDEPVEDGVSETEWARVAMESQPGYHGRFPADATDMDMFPDATAPRGGTQFGGTL